MAEWYDVLEAFEPLRDRGPSPGNDCWYRSRTASTGIGELGS